MANESLSSIAFLKVRFCKFCELLFLHAGTHGLDQDRVLSLELHSALVGLGLLLGRRLLQLLQGVGLLGS